MVAKDGCDGVGNKENEINDSNSRRRVMDVKLSFRRKKKSRLDGGHPDTGRNGATTGNRVAKRQQNNNDKLDKSSEEKTKRTLFSRIFYFRRDRKRTSNSHISKNISQPEESAEQAVQTCDSSFPQTASSDDKERSEKACLENGYQSHSSVPRTDMSSSISSPNLATIKWPLFENIDENVSRGKYASFKRSRASVVFPIVESFEDDCIDIHLSNSERHLQQTVQPNTNNAIYSDFCLHKDIDNKSCDKAEGVCSRNTPSLSRTNDGRSPYPRRHTPCYETFSSPNIFEESDRRVIRTKLYQFTSVENVKDYKGHGVGGDLSSNVGAHPATSYTLKMKEGDDDDDFVFVSAGSQNAVESSGKKLSRYTSCPGNLETEMYTKQLGSNFPFHGSASKPYSSHRRPYSLHEGVMSVSLLETNAVSVIIEKGDEEEDEFELPPDDDLCLPSKDLPVGLAEALWDHSGKLKTELSFRAGETIAVYFMSKKKWWWGTIDDRKGWFPSSHVRLRVDQKLNDSELSTWNHSSRQLQSTAIGQNTFSLLGMQADFCTETEVRSKCIQELLSSEQDYLKTLKDVTEGYLNRAKKKTEMFSSEDIDIIFCNIEKIYRFHKKFHRELEEEISKHSMLNSQIGKIFISHKADFEIYSEYCNNHPKACARLLELQKEKEFRLFFESCRLLQKMISLSVDAFLLTPVQKICKYPLQLKELLKHTPKEHPDHNQLQFAVQTMKDVASSINEKKRKFENFNWIAEWQLNVESWQGADILEVSSEMIKTGSIESLFGGKREKIHLSLFDHQLILCKMDSLKKPAKLVYENRINLDNSRIDTVDDQTGDIGSSLIRITDFGENITYWLSAKEADENEKWRSAFKKERQIVANESTNGVSIPLAMRRTAMQSAKTKRQAELKKGSRRRKSLTDPFQEFGSSVVRRSLRLRRTQSLRDKKHQVSH